MNENINLCELLKEHAGEIFYSPVYGEIKLKEIGNDTIGFNVLNNDIYTFFFNKEGKLNVFCDTDKAECLLFPSKDQRDWNKWAEEQKRKKEQEPKTPKTWSEIADSDISQKWGKPAFALMKILQIIEVGYGGIPTMEERKRDHDCVYVPAYTPNKGFDVIVCFEHFDPIAFYSEGLCKEFLSHPENVELLKDFYML